MFIAIANRFGATSVGSNSSDADVERVGERALGVHLAHQRAAAVPRGDVGDRGRDGGLADATLAGDPEQVEVEQPRPTRGAQVQPPKPMRRSPSAEPSSM